MSARLDALLAGLDADLRGRGDVAIDDIAYDSRRVKPGALFCALRGAVTDGHQYVGEAVDAGAAALVVERAPDPAPRVPVAVVRDARAALADVSARFFGEPGRALELTGVTGTNGKTSTVRMLESILTAAGRHAGSAGTISVRYAGREEPALLTTPESTDLQRTLAQMRDAGVETVALEVSSHSLALGRVRGLRFAAGVFCQLTQDHLDFHSDMEDYAAAKARLFGPDHLDGAAVLNAADPLSRRLARLARSAGRDVLRYGRGRDAEADLRTVEEQVTLDGARARVAHGDTARDLVVPLPGDFQLDNALAAAGAALSLGVGWDAIARGLERCPPIPGRLERVSGPGDGPHVFVDYAHTPAALDRVLARVKPLVAGRLVCVFGCGGDRDRGKRAPMARAACRHADVAIATSDNPRTEDPEAILRDVAAGLEAGSEVVVDRRAAIRRAVALARPGDAVVIAGKGHEDYQIVGRERRPFDDRVEARAALAERGDSP